MSYAHTARVIRARKSRRCSTAETYPRPGCLRQIAPGDLYVRSVIFPGHDSGYAGHRGERGARPLAHAYCLACVEHYADLRPLLASVGESLSARVVRCLNGYKFSYTDELGLHDSIEKALADEFDAVREYRLTSRERIDFMVGGHLGIEVKVAGSSEAAARQLLRYFASPEISSIVLVTTKSRHRHVPALTPGCDVAVVTVHGAAW